MAFSWKRAIANAVAPAALAMCALLVPPAALAAKNSDPCKTNAKSAACKAQPVSYTHLTLPTIYSV